MTDAAYHAWIQTLPSVFDGKSYSEWLPDVGEWRNPACHVRRGGFSGVAYKKPFSQIPMTNTEHAYQHNHGELACLMKYTRDPQLKTTLMNASPVEAERIAGEWFDAQVIRYREMWRERTGEAPWEAEGFANG